MAFEPTLPKPKRKHLTIEDKNNLIVMGKLSGVLKEMLLKDYEIVNLNTFYSIRENKHIAIITYYE